ncbi:uncharacterized protein LOC102807505, partial [Saccoglossus kowalevskii]|uniref:Dystonin-like n=1 Tax=Saccoglossus kowalevskii TaxID=10224 RepID=A0ABM0LX78_SACKO
MITEFRTTVLPRKFNREYKEEPELETVKNKITEITTRYEKLTVEFTKHIETLHVIIMKHTTLEPTTVGVKSVVDDREKAADDREKKLIKDELKEHSYNLEKLLKWVSAVEISLGSEQPLKEEPRQLNKQVKSNKVIAADVDDHKKPVTDALSGADIFLATYGDKVDDVEAEKLRRDHADLTKRYKKVADETDDRNSNLDDSKKTLDLFTKKVSSFETWLVPSERTLKKLQDGVPKDPSKLKEQEKTAKKFAADVADHKEELDDTNETGQHFIDEAKEFKDMITEFRTTVLPRKFNREYKEEPELETVKNKMTEITTRYEKLTIEFTKHIETLHVIIMKHTTLEPTTVGVKSVVDDREKAEDDREKKLIKDELKEHSYNLEKLLKWVSAVEISLGSEQPLKEEPRQLNKQVKSNKVIAADVDDHKKPVTDALSGADIFLATYGDKVDDVEAEKLRRDHADLTKRYKKVADETDDRNSNLDDSKKTLDLFTKKVSSFETWLVPSERTLKKLQDGVPKDPSKLKEQEKTAKKFAADVADHKEELDDTNETGQHFIDEAKEFKDMITEFRTTVLPRKFNREYKEEPELETVKNKMTEITTRYEKLTIEFTKHIETLHVIIMKHTTLEPTTVGVKSVVDDREKAEDDREKGR